MFLLLCHKSSRGHNTQTRAAACGQRCSVNIFVAVLDRLIDWFFLTAHCWWISPSSTAVIVISALSGWCQREQKLYSAIRIDQCKEMHYFDSDLTARSFWVWRFFRPSAADWLQTLKAPAACASLSARCIWPTKNNIHMWRFHLTHPSSRMDCFLDFSRLNLSVRKKTIWTMSEVWNKDIISRFTGCEQSPAQEDSTRAQEIRLANEICECERSL